MNYDVGTDSANAVSLPSGLEVWLQPRLFDVPVDDSTRGAYAWEPKQSFQEMARRFGAG